MNYLNERIEQDEVLILQANMPQLRFLGDFSHTIVIPLVDEDAVFHLYGLYRKDDENKVKPLLNALSRARKIIINHKDQPLVEREETS